MPVLTKKNFNSAMKSNIIQKIGNILQEFILKAVETA
jgi:hypothetical protein